MQSPGVVSHRVLSPVDLAWVAGLLEGEGFFTIAKPHYMDNGKLRGRGQVGIGCGMTDEDVILKLRAITGVGIIFQDRRSGRNPKHKQLHTWRLSKRADVEYLLPRLRPLMGRRRGERIDEMLAYLAKHPPIQNQPAPCGTVKSYSRGCRCEPCREADRERCRLRYHARKAAA